MTNNGVETTGKHPKKVTYRFRGEMSQPVGGGGIKGFKYRTTRTGKEKKRRSVKTTLQGVNGDQRAGAAVTKVGTTDFGNARGDFLQRSADNVVRECCAAGSPFRYFNGCVQNLPFHEANWFPPPQDSC